MAATFRLKRTLFYTAMLLMPVLFFVFLEGVLRLVGFGASYPLFVPVEHHPAHLTSSREVGKRYFVNQSAPSIPFDSFRASKAPNTFRIFVQGGSTAAGFPYYYGACFPDILEARLQATYPDKEIEVVNTAMAAVNSYTLLDLAEEIVAQSPDAVLIYAGHNEYYGALGVGSSESVGQLRPLINLYLGIRHYRVVQGLRHILTQGARLLQSNSAERASEGTLMQRMVREQAIPYGSQTYQNGMGQFRGNLEDLLATYQSAGIPVYISTLVSNERHQPPFASGLADETNEEEWRAIFRQGLQAAIDGDTTRALVLLDTLIQRDSLSAEVFYTKARLLDEQGAYDSARRAYLDAKDRDQLPFRAPEAWNQVIRESADAFGAHLVDAQQAMRLNAPGGIIGNEFMLEHLHPNIEGYFQIADAFYEALVSTIELGRSPQSVPDSVARRAFVLVTAVDSISGVYRYRRLIGGWPFQPPGVIDEELVRLEATTPEEELALQYYNDELSWGRALDDLRGLYVENQLPQKALHAARAVSLRYPFLERPLLAAGDLALELQRYDEALRYYTRANGIQESATALRMMGSITLQQGAREEAVAYLERSRILEPSNTQTLYNLSGAYALVNRLDDAHVTVTQLLELDPDHQAGRQLLASLEQTR